MKKAIGYILIASPFICLYGAFFSFLGFIAGLKVIGITSIIISVLVLGVYLIDSDK